ncbi:unnamed protein product [Parnassius mnemosyne]|uniref:Jumonji domain-containing protein 4 n=1 Tax=Parnassius mnemosyne TaxID=213953 RepID=A0AAV1M5L9_9NEOP
MELIEISNTIKHIPKYDYSSYEIVTVDSFHLKYEDFYEKFMLKNLPCIIQNISVNWDCSKNWVENGNINIDYIISEYGNLEAPIADCNKINFNAHCKQNMEVKDFMSYLRNSRKENLLYLKDWHLRKNKPNHKFYDVPEIFASDWLNEFAEDNNEDDFMFVYIGPKESWTSFHSDVYSSYSWSVNIIGRKRWILLPPGEENKLRDQFGNLPLLFNPQEANNVKFFEVIQERGDAIFVPSGWHHQVVNILDTISINHNFINASNVGLVWEALQQNLISVENEIQEFRNTIDFITQCQLILKSVFGMDYTMFMNLIIHIGTKRIQQFYGKNFSTFHKFAFGKNHIIFDLNIISQLLCLIQKHPLYKSECTTPSIKESVLNILTAIEMLNK